MALTLKRHTAQARDIEMKRSDEQRTTLDKRTWSCKKEAHEYKLSNCTRGYDLQCVMLSH